MIRAPRPLRTLPLLAVAILAGCSDRRAAEAAGAAVAAAAPRFEIQDSAGIPIVVNAEPGPHMPRFQLAQPAAATIGVVEGAPEYQLFRVGSGVVLADGTIVIANVGTMELRFYDGTGTYLRSAGRRGQGPGELMNLRIVGAFADDSILVWDFNQTRFSVFDREGAFGRSYSIQATPFLPPIPQGVLSDGEP